MGARRHHGPVAPHLLRTPRLSLARPAPGDLEDLQVMWSDPAVRQRSPSLRHTQRTTSEASLARGVRAWQRDGLGWSVARSIDPDDGKAGTLVGNGGCTLSQDLVWNLGYRLVRSAWGQG